MTYAIIALLIAVVAGGALFARSLVNRGGSIVGARLGRYGMAGASGGNLPVSQIISAGTGSRTQVSERVNRAVLRSRFGNKIAVRLREADLKITPGEYVIMVIAFVVLVALVGLLFKGIIGLIIAVVISPFLPRLYLRRRAKKRRQAFLEQLADGCQMMANSMRAGFSIIQSMELVGSEGVPPAKDEFERVVTEIKLGLPLDTALEHLLERMPSEDLGLMIVAINVQRQVGGNLAEILMVIAKTVRDRVRFQRDLATLTAQARYSSYVITALPIGVGIVINFMDNAYERFLYTALLGEIMVGIALCMVGLGFFFLNRIANIEV
jgi:tight adherence protein B